MERSRIIELIKSHLDDHNVEYSTLEIKTNFRDDLGLDSLEVLELILYLESKLDINLNIEEMYSIDTINDLVKYINNIYGVK